MGQPKGIGSPAAPTTTGVNRAQDASSVPAGDREALLAAVTPEQQAAALRMLMANRTYDLSASAEDFSTLYSELANQPKVGEATAKLLELMQRELDR